MTIFAYFIEIFISILTMLIQSSFRNIHKRFFLSFQVFREVVNQTPVEVFVHIAEAMTLLRKHEHIETLAGTNQCIDYTHGITRVYIVVNITVNQQQVSLQVLGNLRIGSNLIDKGSIALFADLFLHP